MNNTSLICFVVLFIAAEAATANDYVPSPFIQPPKVGNVSASQGINDNLVHIYYDLTNPGPDGVGDCSVTLEFSDDAGETWETVSNADGDVGYLINPGTAKYISWQGPGPETVLPPVSCRFPPAVRPLFGRFPGWRASPPRCAPRGGPSGALSRPD